MTPAACAILYRYEKFSISDINATINWAIQFGQIDMVKMLLHYPVNYSSLLHLSYYSGCKEILQTLLKDPRTDPFFSDSNGRLPIHYASEVGASDILNQYLRDSRHDPSIPDMLGWYAIHFACYNGSSDCLRLLLQDQRVDPNIATSDGCRPLHFACREGSFGW